MKGDAAATRRLLSEKADVNATQVDGATALHWAVYRNEVETAQLLIAAGADTKAANREGITPLFMAALYGNPRMVEVLVKSGEVELYGSVRTRDEKRFTEDVEERVLGVREVNNNLKVRPVDEVIGTARSGASVRGLTETPPPEPTKTK